MNLVQVENEVNRQNSYELPYINCYRHKILLTAIELVRFELIENPQFIFRTLRRIVSSIIFISHNERNLDWI